MTAMPTPAQAQVQEHVPSVTVESMYRIESEQMRLSEFPNTLRLYDVLMIDIDHLGEAEYLEADLYLPVVPDGLDDIVLFDGWHVAHFTFTRVGEGCIHIRTRADSVADFDGTVGLFLFVTGRE